MFHWRTLALPCRGEEILILKESSQEVSKKFSDMYHSNYPRHWRVVAEEVTREQDGEKMTVLIEELLEALERAKKLDGVKPDDLRHPRDLSRTA
jgi:hypothetical protein